MINKTVAMKSDMASAEEFYSLEQSYIKTMFLTAYGENFQGLNDALLAMERINKEYSVEEVIAIGKLCDKDNPITVGELVRFTYRVVPLTFLENMDEDIDELELMSDVDLVNFILNKFSNERFKVKAKKLFYIES